MSDLLAVADLQPRVAALEARPSRNGIDYVEVPRDDQTRIEVHLFNRTPTNMYGFPENLSRIEIRGGTRVVGIVATGIERPDPRQLVIHVSEPGDFSVYTLVLDDDRLDPLWRQVDFSFKAGCSVDFDCRGGRRPTLPVRDDLQLDYLAKDYASFRGLMLDLLPQLNPGFVERSPADLGIALVELLAYEADRISYAQDAVANEAFLATARHRISVRRHARLVDYLMHDGRNAWAALHVTAADVPGTLLLPRGTQVLTRIASPLPGDAAPPGPAIAAARLPAGPGSALAAATVFETAHDLVCHRENDELRIHAWGGEEAVLPAGATDVFLYAVRGTTAVAPPLAPGDRLVLEEVVGPATGLAADADPAHRHVVRLTAADATTDPLYAAALADGRPAPVTGNAAALPLVHAAWGVDDALPFPLVVSFRAEDGTLVEDVSVARGNVVLADHGRTVVEASAQAEPEPFEEEPASPDAALRSFRLDDRSKRVWPDGATITVERSADGGASWAAVDPDEYSLDRASGSVEFAAPQPAGTLVRVTGAAQPPPAPVDASFRLALGQGPLTMQCPPPAGTRGPLYGADGRLAVDRLDLECAPGDASPAVAVSVSATWPPVSRDLWTPVPDLLDSAPFAEEFVAETDDDGRALLRFGDGEYGRSIAGALDFRATYRVGNGAAGNVGAESLAHVVVPDGADLGWVAGVRNPLAARDGVDPEPIDDVRLRAPQAFRAEQVRAVTEADYAAAALAVDGVSGSVASFRWTGSWTTVFVGVDPADGADLLRLPDGRFALADDLEARVADALEAARLAGYDVRIVAPEFVPLDVGIELCVDGDHFRGDVVQAVREALEPGTPTGGGAPGLFDPANWSFGQPVYLSRVYAALKQVEGVASAVVTRFRRFGGPDDSALDTGSIPIGPWQIAQLEDDPSFMEHGVLRLTGTGGKA